MHRPDNLVQADEILPTSVESTKNLSDLLAGGTIMARTNILEPLRFIWPTIPSLSSALANYRFVRLGRREYCDFARMNAIKCDDLQ